MRQAPWALIVWDTLKWTRHPTRWGQMGTALERTFHWSPPSRGWEKRLVAKHSFPWQPRWASIWQRGAHSAPCCLHQIWWAIGQGEQQPLERLTSGLCNCWQGVALTPLASPHMDVKQLHSRCLRNMVQTRKRDWSLVITKPSREHQKSMHVMCNRHRSESWKRCSETYVLAMFVQTRPGRAWCKDVMTQLQFSQPFYRCLRRRRVHLRNHPWCQSSPARQFLEMSRVRAHPTSSP